MTDPTIGVWISDDGEVGAPDPRNLYRYVGNNPTNEVDPSGLSGEKPNEHQIDKTWTQKDILEDFDKWAKDRRWPAAKIAKYRADLVSLLETASGAEVAKSQTGVNQCVKWVSAVIEHWPRKTNLIKIEIESWEYPAGISYTNHFLGHSAILVVLPNGRGFYLDNGWWGNSDHIFGSPNISALARPVGYFEKPWWPINAIGEFLK